MENIQAILDYWFEGVDDTIAIDKKVAPFHKWFISDQKMDADIRRRFEPDLLAAVEGQYQEWEETAQGRLALIILFDQFSRNMYRGTARMYAYDALALKMTLDALSRGQEEGLPLVHRTFLYMPLMHSEDPDMQKLSLECFTKLAEAAKMDVPGNAPYYEYTLRYAQGHHDDIIKDGRFIYRDAILNRGGS